MPHTDKVTVLAQAIMAVLETNKAALGLDDVLYGDQQNIPKAKTAVVSAGTKNRVLDGVAMPGGMSRNFMKVVITIYNSTVGAEEAQRLVVDQQAEAVEAKLHEDTTVGGIIIHGYVESIEPGVTFRAGSMFKATQLTFIGQTKTRITP